MFRCTEPRTGGPGSILAARTPSLPLNSALSRAPARRWPGIGPPPGRPASQPRGEPAPLCWWPQSHKKPFSSSSSSREHSPHHSAQFGVPGGLGDIRQLPTAANWARSPSCWYNWRFPVIAQSQVCHLTVSLAVPDMLFTKGILFITLAYQS